MTVEQCAGRARLTTQLADASRDVDVEVRIRVEHPRYRREVLGIAANVHGNEGGPRAFGNECLKRVDEAFKDGKFRSVHRPLRMDRELLESLVRRVDGLEE